jgi:predicted nucleic acid-binding protein
VEPEDSFHPAAKAMILDAKGPAAALDLTLYEIGNVIGVKKGLSRAAEHMSQLIGDRCGDHLVRVDAGLLGSICDCASRHGLSAYDAAYVSTAERYGWTLVSTDIRDLVSKGLAVTPDAADYS